MSRYRAQFSRQLTAMRPLTAATPALSAARNIDGESAPSDRKYYRPEPEVEVSRRRGGDARTTPVLRADCTDDTAHQPTTNDIYGIQSSIYYEHRGKKTRPINQRFVAFCSINVGSVMRSSRVEKSAGSQICHSQTAQC